MENRGRRTIAARRSAVSLDRRNADDGKSQRDAGTRFPQVRTSNGLTPSDRPALQMLDVHLPTTDGREVILTRYTQPEPDQQLVLAQLQLKLPEQPRPKITAAQARSQ